MTPRAHQLGKTCPLEETLGCALLQALLEERRLLLEERRLLLEQRRLLAARLQDDWRRRKSWPKELSGEHRGLTLTPALVAACLRPTKTDRADTRAGGRRV